MDELLTTERILFLLLAFCMGAKVLGFVWNGRSIQIKADRELDERLDQ